MQGKITVDQLAQKVATALNGRYGWKCKVWSGNGERRVYVGKFGYVLIGENGIDQDKVTYYRKEVAELLADLSSIIPAEDIERAAMVTRHGLGEVLDAEADIAREDWDI
jgi:hypothetical protein